MMSTHSDLSIPEGGRPSRRQFAVFATMTILAGAIAVVLITRFDIQWQQAAALPLGVVGTFLAYWNIHWALCFAAFSIAPFGVVQLEVASVTLNFPEALILALAAMEGVRLVWYRQQLPRPLPTIPVLLFVIAAAIAVGTGIMRGNGTVHVLQDCRQFTEFLVLFWLVLQRVSGRDGAIQIAICYVLGAALLAMHGIIQQFAPVNIVQSQLASDLVVYSGVRSSSFYGATALGGLLVLTVGSAVGVALSTRRRAVQVLMGLCIVLCLIAILFTRTRGSWLGLAVALVLIGVSLRPSGKTLAVAAGIGLLLALVGGPLILQRLYTLADPVRDMSFMARAQYYTAAAHIGRAHPVFGLGWGCHYDIEAILRAEHYVPVTREETEARKAIERAGEADRAAALGVGGLGATKGELLIERVEAEESTVHSAYLQLFVKTGFVGLLAFLAIITAWVERIWRGRNTRLQGDDTHALFVGTTAGVAGYLFHSTFENFFQWPVMAQSFWLLLALSFLLAPRPAGQRPQFGVPVVFVGCSLAVFLLFVVVCGRLETLHPGHYMRNVERALDEDNLDKAIQIARSAAEIEPADPGPHTTHSRLLFMQGETEAALAELDKAFDSDDWPGITRLQRTGIRYYFAPARLTLGKYYAEIGDWDRAVRQFELARAYTNLTDAEYAEFHLLIYEAYARRGRWDRALDFSEPNGPELDNLTSASILRAAQVCEGKENWDFLAILAQMLVDRGSYPREADYFLGRARLARGEVDSALAPLERAAAAEIPHASYFAGMALLEANRRGDTINALRATRARDPYRALALAKAWQLLPTGAGSPDAAKILEGIRDVVSHMERVPHVGENPENNTTTLLRYSLPPAEDTGSGRFPALFLWGHQPTNLEGLEDVSRVTTESESVVRLEGTKLMIELRWVENLLDWEGVERMGPTGETPLGWIDTRRDWFHLDDESAAAVVRDPAGNLGLQVEGLAWMYGIPTVLPKDNSCLFAGRLYDPHGSGRFSVQYLDHESRVVGGRVLSEREPITAWTRYKAYIPASAAREAVRMTIETIRLDGRVASDDLVLVALKPPLMETSVNAMN